MARVTIEDCLEHVDNRFGLVALAAKRARELLTTNIDPLVAWENDKATVVALREIAEGLITQENVGQHAKHEKTDKELTAELSAEFQRLAEEAENNPSEDPSQE